MAKKKKGASPPEAPPPPQEPASPPAKKKLGLMETVVTEEGRARAVAMTAGQSKLADDLAKAPYKPGKGVWIPDPEQPVF